MSLKYEPAWEMLQSGYVSLAFHPSIAVIPNVCVVCLVGVNDGAMSKLHRDHVSNFKGVSSESVDAFYHTERAIRCPTRHT